MTLTAAHKGYEYQDIYSAYLILKSFRNLKDFEFTIDKKEYSGDSFDDLIITTSKEKTKFQIRHSSLPFLTLDDFRSEGNFSIKKLSKTSAAGIPTVYVLATTRALDPSEEFFKSEESQSFLLSKKVWTIAENAFLDTETKAFLKNFKIDSELPKVSQDFDNPGDLESIIFEYLKKEIGLGGYPNDLLSPEVFAIALCRLVRSVRIGNIKQPVSKSALVELFQTSGLKIDYGHIAQQFPLVPGTQRLYFKNLQAELRENCLSSQNVILSGLPGSGKSHQFDNLFHNLKKEKDAIVVQHYCYLEPTDDHVLEHINLNRMFGNIVYQLTSLFPSIAEHLPRLYAADRIKIEEFAKAIILKEKKRLIIMIDGLDHLERIINQRGVLSPAYVNTFINELLNLRLPENSCLLISSQPGPHLEKFQKRPGAKLLEVRPWDEKETAKYLIKEGLAKEVLGSEKNGNTFISTIFGISEGNPLYLNYLAKEIKEAIFKNVDLWHVTKGLPQLKSNINEYYTHLLYTIEQRDLSIAETIALLDFSITKEELGEMFPVIDRDRVFSVLKKLGPVLRDNFSIGGLRIYHESFRCFVLEGALKRKIKKSDLYSHIVNWLVGLGFFDSVISYNYLFSYFRRSGQSQRIDAFVTKDFLTESIFNFHLTDSISKNIALAADYAAERPNWRLMARLTQINTALYAYSEEREGMEAEVAETYLQIFGPEAFSKRMTMNGKGIFSLAFGFKYCHKIAKMGGNAPWASYDLAAFSMDTSSEDKKITFHELEAGLYNKNIFGKDIKTAFLYLSKILKRKGKFSDQIRSDLLINQLFIQFDSDSVFENLFNLDSISTFSIENFLSFSTYIKKEKHKKELLKNILHKNQFLSSGDLFRLAKSGIKITQLLNSREFIKNFKLNSKAVIETTKSPYEKEVDIFKNWYHELYIVALIRPALLKELRTKIRVDGWYRAWLRYLIDLALSEVLLVPQEQEKEVLRALGELSKSKEPFAGSPRACDLYSIHRLTIDSFSRSVLLISSESTMVEAISLLEEISLRTTTTLQRSPSGPLTEDALSAIFAKNIDSKNQNVQKILKEAILTQYKIVSNRGRFYEIQASEGMKSACVLMRLGEKAKAKQIFKEACQYAYGYGMRKDITLWEIIEPIPSLFNLSKIMGIRALQKTYLLPYIVGRQTDGAETRWALSRWYESLFDSDRALGIRFLTEDIKLNHGERDWRIEYISEALANDLVKEVNPVIVAELYESLNMDEFDRTDFGPRLELLEIFCKKGISVDKYAYDLSIYLSVWRYTMTDQAPYIKIIKTFFSLQRKYGFNLSPYIKRELREKIKKKVSVTSTIKEKKVKRKKVVIFNSLMDVDQLNLVLGESSREDLCEVYNIEAFCVSVMEVIKKGDKEGGYSTLVNYARKASASGPLLTLEKMGDIFLSKDSKDLAAKAYALGFFYSRGSMGWSVLGDKESYPMAVKSVAISKKIFHLILAKETAQAIEKPGYFIGGNRHLIEVFSNVTKELYTAWGMWYESFVIINHRLPSVRLGWNKMPNNLNLKKSSLTIEQEVIKLIEQRKKIKP